MKNINNRPNGVNKKTYTVKQLADLAHVSVRTLHFYDESGLLKPSFVKDNGYRFYEEKELLRLQQILFFRELEFPLEDIKKIIDSPEFDEVLMLREHRKLLEIKSKRLQGLLKTIDKTIKKMTNNTSMKDEDLYGSFNKEEMEKYQEEAKKRWGHTEAYKQSTERVKKMGKEGLAKVQKDNEDLLKEIANSMSKDPGDEDVQVLISRHYDGIRKFYDPSPEMYRGLGEMYVADERFTAYFEKFGKGLAVFMRDAMKIFADRKEK